LITWLAFVKFVCLFCEKYFGGGILIREGEGAQRRGALIVLIEDGATHGGSSPDSVGLLCCSFLVSRVECGRVSYKRILITSSV